MHLLQITASLAVLSISVLGGRSPHYQYLPSLREQAQIQDGWRQERLAAIPALLNKHGVDAWLMSQKEYAEDTAFWSLKKAQQYSARRRTVSLYFSNQDGGHCNSYTWIDITDDVWGEVKDVLERCSPRSIVVNTDPQIAFASGLHAGEWDLIQTQLESKWINRMTNKPEVAIEYIATMPQSQLDWYRRLQETAWALITEAFSERVITPEQTKTADVEWWLREKLQSLNYTTWFHPDVTVVLPSTEVPKNPPFRGKELIEYGDMLHVDFGVTALGLNTDTQHLAYVLPPGGSEKDVPKSFLDGLRKANDLQDIVRGMMKSGLTGNQILKYAQDEMHFQAIEGRIYSHPIGDWGHSAGTLIGMSNLQEGVPILGDLKLLKDMYYSIELYAEHFVPETNDTFNFFLEEDVYWNRESERFDWVYGRQEEFHLIKSPDSDMLRIQG